MAYKAGMKQTPLSTIRSVLRIVLALVAIPFILYRISFLETEGVTWLVGAVAITLAISLVALLVYRLLLAILIMGHKAESDLNKEQGKTPE
jgi:hypothetical protein